MRSNWLRTAAAPPCAIWLATLAACAPTTATVVPTSRADAAPAVAGETTHVACHAFEPLTWSRADSDETIRSVKAHNAAWDSLCGIKH